MPHIHEKIDYTVEVFVVHKGKVLLRKHDKYKLWLSIGGHVELDEDPTQAALREVREEAGLAVTLDQSRLETTESTPQYTELIPPRFMNRHRINPTHEHVCLVYFARSETDSVINEGDEVSEEIRWFSKTDLEDRELTPRIRHYAKTALAELI